MANKIEEWIAQSGEWRQSLEEALAKAPSADNWIPYDRVARAFPAAEPNPYFFDIPQMDWAELREWAGKHGWTYEIITEGVPEEQKNAPPIRFMRIAGR